LPARQGFIDPAGPGMGPVCGQCVVAFVAEIAALVEWYRRHASESPAEVMLYRWVLSKPAHEVMQAAMLAY